LLCATHTYGEVQVISNPHMPQSAQTCHTPCSAQTLDPSTIIQTQLPVQADTFQSLKIVKYLGTPVPVYQFKQPARLSSLELPFSIVNVQSLGWADDVVVVPVAEEKGLDSWVRFRLICAELGCY